MANCAGEPPDEDRQPAKARASRRDGTRTSNTSRGTASPLRARPRAKTGSSRRRRGHQGTPRRARVDKGKHPVTLLVVQLLFGLFPVAAKKAFEEFDPFPVLGLRLGGAAFLLLVLHLVLVKDAIPMRTEWRKVLLLAMLGVVLNMGLFIVGVKLTTAVNAVLVITSIPVFKPMHTPLREKA